MTAKEYCVSRDIQDSQLGDNENDELGEETIALLDSLLGAKKFAKGFAPIIPHDLPIEDDKYYEQA